MKSLTIHATDGEIGSIEAFYFDDEKWTIRYLVVKTGAWLSKRQVLISPIFYDPRRLGFETTSHL
jgi:hypothetical protein